MRTKVFFFLYIFFFTGCLFAQNACDSLTGMWHREGGAALKITSIDENGMLQGKYLSIDDTTNTFYPLVGWANTTVEGGSRAIGFTVSWAPAYKSITAWTGYCDVNQETEKVELYFLWHLVRPDIDEAWARIHTNQSTFYREKVK